MFHGAKWIGCPEIPDGYILPLSTLDEFARLAEEATTFNA